MMAGELFIGLMSGTSLDGVDAALVRFKDQGMPEILHTHFVAYPASLRTALLALQHPTPNELETTALLANQLSRLYAQSVHELLQTAGVSDQTVTAIGCHGQTIRHRPDLGFTMQISNPALLAELTGISVVSDFRSRDIAAGGQGAPLVPIFHQAMFASRSHNRAIINIGGIANITYLPTSGKLLGFDSGPGNMLMDMWIQRHLSLDYDANGDWARGGKVIPELLHKMLTEPYFASTPPKSTGRDLFNEHWLNQRISQQEYAPQDIARTLLALTAKTISQAITDFCPNTNEVYLCGGGAKNALLCEALAIEMPQIPIFNTDTFGIGIDWAEAVAFAWLAKQCIQAQAINLSSVTGAGGPRILGAIYQH